MENHKRSASAHSSADFCTWRCHGIMHGQGVSSLRLGILGPWPHTKLQPRRARWRIISEALPPIHRFLHMALSWHDAWARCELFEAWHPWTMTSLTSSPRSKLQPRRARWRSTRARWKSILLSDMVSLDERSHPLFTFMFMMPSKALSRCNLDDTSYI